MIQVEQLKETSEAGMTGGMAATAVILMPTVLIVRTDPIVLDCVALDAHIGGLSVVTAVGMQAAIIMMFISALVEQAL